MRYLIETAVADQTALGQDKICRSQRSSEEAVNTTHLISVVGCHQHLAGLHSVKYGQQQVPIQVFTCQLNNKYISIRIHSSKTA